VDSNGNLYIADSGNNVVREVSGGTIATIAGNGHSSGCANGSAANAVFNSPTGLAVDSHSNVYVVDTENYCVRKISNGTVTNVAGNGTPSTFGPGANIGDGGAATNATLSYTQGVAVDSSGNLYIADAGDQRIREVNAVTGFITTVAGGGTCTPFCGDGGSATAAVLKSPLGVVVDSQGDIFIADTSDNVIREVTGGIIDTVAGDNALGAGFSGDTGRAAQAQLSSPQMVALDGRGNLYIADQGNNRIREVSGGVINTIVGNGSIGDGGPATGAQLEMPVSLALDGSGNLYIADSGASRVRMVAATTGTITTVAGNGTAGGSVTNGSPATGVGLNGPFAVAVDRNGNIYIADTFEFTILEVSGGLIFNFAGNGTAGYSGDGNAATAAEIGNSYGIATDSTNNVYFSDSLETSTATVAHVREVSRGIISTAAGNGDIGDAGDGGPATAAELNFPAGLAVDSFGNLYITDVYENVIRKVSAGTISTVAGNAQLGPGFSGDGGPATSAALNNPGGVAVDSNGNIYIADTSNNRIRMVSASTGIINTIAGNGLRGYTGDYGPATSAELDSPFDVAVTSNGTVLVADSSGRIRVLTTSNSACTFGGVLSTVQVGAAGGSRSISVQTTAFCPWSISGLPSWITLAGPANNTGPGAAILSIAANSGEPRSATITIAGVSVTVNQAATAAPVPAGVTATAGTPQTTAVGTPFGTALQATVTDSGGNLLSGVTVNFSAPSSGASATLSSSSAVTNSVGIASVAATANGTAGAYSVNATVSGVSNPAFFSLTNTPGPPSTIAVTSGTPQSTAIGTAFSSALLVTVKDSGGNPLNGVTVTFSTPSSGASATLSSSTATTNSSGQASVTVTANGTAGTYSVSATVSGVSTPATFSLTNTTGSPASITATSGTPQSTAIGTAFSSALLVTVKDSGGNPLNGVTVTFSTPSSGASATLSSSTATTNSSGQASVTVTANGTAGTYSVSATVSGVSTPATFSLTNTTGPSSGSAALWGVIASKSGSQNARVWTVLVGNSGTGLAASAQISRIVFTQTFGASCTPEATTTFPVALGSIAAGSSADGAVTIDFTGCPNDARFTVRVGLSANSGAVVTTILRNDEER
jgi:hypothetical protein